MYKDDKAMTSLGNDMSRCDDKAMTSLGNDITRLYDLHVSFMLGSHNNTHIRSR